MSRAKRKRMLRKLLLKNMLNGNSARRVYESPLDRDTYNYGYMTSAEMGADQVIA